MSETRVVHVKDNIPGAIYIGRAMPRRGLKGSEWANPYKIGEYGRDRAEVIRLYREGLVSNLLSPSFGPEFRQRLETLRGKPLACWCRHDGEEPGPDNACHGDVLIEILNGRGGAS